MAYWTKLTILYLWTRWEFNELLHFPCSGKRDIIIT